MALDALAPCEREVQRRGARSHTCREAAAELVLSERTMETNMSSALRKLQLSHRRELARWAEDARGASRRE